ncbi:MAG: heterocyst frequency control protein PatD [Coleofasciculaceae cyanobacterium SM2_1_6]|nr:heterocyst frequency control protein PatD [Coleofasciculaceae cyanobacterium SM2_1_6]
MNNFSPDSYAKKYQQLLNLLTRLTNMSLDMAFFLTPPEPNPWQELAQVYTQEILPLTGEELPPEIVAKWRSIQTEIHRAMKLLTTDISLLRAARSPELQSQRQKVLLDRLTTLTTYCQVILTWEI